MTWKLDKDDNRGVICVTWRYNWFLRLSLILAAASTLLYLLHYLIFRDAHHIFVFLLHDIAFVPVHVLILTLIIDRWLNEREKRATINKLNMVVGAFFNELGTTLLKTLPAFDEEPRRIAAELLVDGTWPDKRFIETRLLVANSHFVIDSRRGDLAALKALMAESRDFLLRLLENSSLNQYESFTDLLLSVSHLSDELAQRPSVDNLPETDYDHLSMDIKRAYRHLIFEWLRHMHHLKRDYPYLFSLAVRMNPFDPDASAIVRGGGGE